MSAVEVQVMSVDAVAAIIWQRMDDSQVYETRTEGYHAKWRGLFGWNSVIPSLPGDHLLHLNLRTPHVVVDMTHLTLAPITYHAITERSKKRSPHSSGYSPASRRACLSSFSGSPCRIFGGKKWYWDTLLSEYVGFSLLSLHLQSSIFILLSSEYV
jgi:hypothetical protein